MTTAAIRLCLGGVACAIATATGVSAAEPSSQPASQPVRSVVAVALKGQITDVGGLVQVRAAPDQPWLKATVGMAVDEGFEFRTGPRSYVTCFIEPGQTFTLDRLGTLRLMDAVRSEGKVHTELLMQYGRTALEVESAGEVHDAKIRSPSSTLAVRGTEVTLYDQPPYRPEAVSFTGRASYATAKRETTLGGTRTARIRGAGNDAAQTALSDSVVDPQVATARSDSDARFVANEVSRGALTRFDTSAQIQTITGGEGPILNDVAFAASLPGEFQLTLRWTGNADVNILGTTQSGDPLTIFLEGYLPTELAFPGYGLDRTASGGKIPFDHRGGTNGGTEVLYWAKAPPQGIFGLSAQHTSGSAADVRLAAFYRGERLTAYILNEDPENPTKGKTIRRTIGPGEEVSTIILFPGLQELEDLVPDDPASPTNVKAKSKAKTVRRR